LDTHSSIHNWSFAGLHSSRLEEKQQNSQNKQGRP
jgi:hypothetical protein